MSMAPETSGATLPSTVSETTAVLQWVEADIARLTDAVRTAPAAHKAEVEASLVARQRQCDGLHAHLRSLRGESTSAAPAGSQLCWHVPVYDE